MANYIVLGQAALETGATGSALMQNTSPALSRTALSQAPCRKVSCSRAGPTEREATAPLLASTPLRSSSCVVLEMFQTSAGRSLHSNAGGWRWI